MKDSTRARVASVVAAASKERRVSSIYDYALSGYRNASADVRNGRVNGYDYGTSSHFTGGGQNGKLDFYDYETSSHVQLKLEGDKFSGYDYLTGHHFSGSVRSGSISIYDYGTSQYHNYSG